MFKKFTLFVMILSKNGLAYFKGEHSVQGHFGYQMMDTLITTVTIITGFINCNVCYRKVYD